VTSPPKGEGELGQGQPGGGQAGGGQAGGGQAGRGPRRIYPEWLTIGDEIVQALDAGATQREVAEKLGRSQAWVNRVARWYLSPRDRADTLVALSSRRRS
jgi:hypothetical protein